jgi:hypothetical protein
MKKIKLAFLSMTFFVINAQAETPKYQCEVKGTYQQIQTSEGTLEVCRMVSSAHCYYIPCHPLGSVVFTTSKVLVPYGVEIEEGRDYWARKEDGVLHINYVQSLNIRHEVENEIETVTIIH